jgi:hypothetical protein
MLFHLFIGICLSKADRTSLNIWKILGTRSLNVIDRHIGSIGAQALPSEHLSMHPDSGSGLAHQYVSVASA